MVREDPRVMRQVDFNGQVKLKRRCARSPTRHQMAAEESNNLIKLRLRLEMLGEK